MSDRKVTVGENTRFTLFIDESGLPHIEIKQDYNATFRVDLCLYGFSDPNEYCDSLKELSKQLMEFSDDVLEGLLKRGKEQNIKNN